jgi:hypothetical protein
MYINNCKVKLSLYAQWRHSRRTEGVGPTHSSPRHQMGVSGESHAPAVFYSWTKALGSRWLGVWVGHTAGLGAEARERFLGSKPNRERIIITSNFSFYGLWILIRNLPCRAVRWTLDESSCEVGVRSPLTVTSVALCPPATGLRTMCTLNKEDCLSIFVMMQGRKFLLRFEVQSTYVTDLKVSLL